MIQINLVRNKLKLSIMVGYFLEKQIYMQKIYVICLSNWWLGHEINFFFVISFTIEFTIF